MTPTPLADVILKRATAIREELGSAALYPSHIAAAAAEFCAAPYTGLGAFSQGNPRFEEERLRYLFAREIKPSGYFRLRLKQNRKAGVEEAPFVPPQWEVVSADKLFLSALTQLHFSYLPAVKTAHTRQAAESLLAHTDAAIYDYVVAQIETICAQLQAKAREAAAIRDWKPKEKFAQPEDLAARFFEKITATQVGNVLTLKFPRFFGATDLKVSIHRADGVYYIQDNGCALRHLGKQVPDAKKRARIVSRVCHKVRRRGSAITGSFVYARQFLIYLQELCFVAHADVYYSRLEQALCRKDTCYVDISQAEPLDVAPLIEELKKGITFAYDENRGLYYWLDMGYSLSSKRCVCLLGFQGSLLRITDGRKGETEGEIFENLYWNSDSLTPYRKQLQKAARRLGGDFDGEAVFVTDSTAQFTRGIFRFFGLSTVLSEYGHHIGV